MKILIVDDSLTVRMDLKSCFEQAGYDVAVASSLAEARREITSDVQLVVLDVLLPDGDGLDFLQELRRSSDVPVVLLSSQDEAESRGLAHGASAYVGKPYSHSAVLNHVASLIRTSQHGRGDYTSTRILVVDDSMTFRAQLNETLSEWGFEVTALGSAKQAIETVEAEPFELMLVDMIMPEMSGPEFCQRVRTIPALRAIPIIMLTARTDSAAVVDAIKAGADDFVSKSSGLQVLRARLEAQLRRLRVERESRRAHMEIQRREAEARASKELMAAKSELVERLEQSERQYRLLAENATDLVSTHRLDGTFTYASPVASQLLGTRPEQLLDSSLFEHCIVEDRAELEKAWRDVSRNEEVVVRFRVEAGEARWLELRAKVFDDEGHRSVLAMTRDITARARMEGRLEAAMALSKSILESVPDAIVASDGKGTIHTFNPAAVQLFGYQSHETIGENVSMLMPAPYRDEHRDYIKHHLTSGDQRLLGKPRELVALHRDGTEIPIDLRIGRHELEGGMLFTAVIRDVSERKQIMTQLQQAREEAERANEAKSAFLAHMSHEIRTPLNAILGFAQVLAGDPELPLRLREHVTTINRSGEHLLALINDVLTMSKIEAGRMELMIECFDLASLVSHLESLFRVRAHDRGLELHVEHRELPRSVMGDAGRIRQILLNLLGNAVKFTECGSVTLQVACEEGEGGELIMVAAVEDTGPGMSPEEIGQLFEPFRQTKSGVQHGGTGLGLSIVKRSVELMRGRLGIDSEVGQGTRFEVAIPLRHGAQVDDDEESLPQIVRLVPGQEVRLLAADDTVSNLQLLRSLLEPMGFELETATDGAEALERAAERSPDLILMDVQMPVVDGEEAIRRIRAGESGVDRSLPIVAVTASAFEEDRQRVLKIGADEFVRKPYQIQHLLRIIGRLVDCDFELASSASNSEDDSINGELDEMHREAMIVAIEAADHEALMRYISEASDDAPARARALRERASVFDYDGVLALLNAESNR